MENKLGLYITNLMTTSIDTDLPKFVRTLAFEELKKLHDDMSRFLFDHIDDIEELHEQEEKNIRTALLLDPKNEEAMYLLIDIELERSNFSKAEELSKDFKKICVKMCQKLASIESRIKDFERKDAS